MASFANKVTKGQPLFAYKFEYLREKRDYYFHNYYDGESDYE